MVLVGCFDLGIGKVFVLILIFLILIFTQAKVSFAAKLNTTNL
jgi:hypothetical protein